MNIFQTIQKFEDDYRKIPVKVVDGYEFNQSDTLKRICLYSNAQFLDGNKDSLGEKVYFDVSTPKVRNASKNIDLDTKDIQFKAVNGASNYFRSWIYRRKAKDWMRENKIARKLNSIPEKVTGVGSIVVKKVAGSQVFDFVDLRNFTCDASAKSLKEGNKTERHYYSPSDLRKMVDVGWDKVEVERAIDDFLVHKQENFVGDDKTTLAEKGKAQYICVHEFNGYIEKSEIDGGEDNSIVPATFMVVLPADKGESAAGGAAKNKEGLKLYKVELTGEEFEGIYKELHYRKVDGRWLGRGIYEECFPMQEVENTRSNWLLMAMRLSQLIVFQTRDKTVLQNILTDIVNGTILKFGDGDPNAMLQRLDTTSADNGSSNLLAGQTEKVMQGLTNAYEVTTGANLPSNIPLGAVQLMNQNANKLFDFIQEDFGLFVEEIFNDWVLPELEKEMSKKGVLEIVDKDELDYLRKHYVNWKVWDTIKQFLMLGQKPTQQQVEMVSGFVRQQLEAQEAMSLEWEKDFLSFEKKVVCQVTDESESPAMLQTLMNVLQMVSQNPAIADSPAFERVLDMVGLAKIDVMPRGGQAMAPPPTAPNPALAPA